jgi:hypothetical protein
MNTEQKAESKKPSIPQLPNTWRSKCHHNYGMHACARVILDETYGLHNIHQKASGTRLFAVSLTALCKGGTVTIFNHNKATLNS